MTIFLSGLTVSNNSSAHSVASFLEFLSADGIVTLVTIMGSIAVAVFTYCFTKRLKIFELYFSKKTTAFEKYIDTALKFSADPNMKIDELLSAFYIACMYCNEDVLKHSQTLITNATKFKDGEISSDIFLYSIGDTIRIFRKDIKYCRKNNF